MTHSLARSLAHVHIFYGVWFSLTRALSRSLTFIFFYRVWLVLFSHAYLSFALSLTLLGKYKSLSVVSFFRQHMRVTNELYNLNPPGGRLSLAWNSNCPSISVGFSSSSPLSPWPKNKQELLSNKENHHKNVKWLSKENKKGIWREVSLQKISRQDFTQFPLSGAANVKI